MLLSIQFFLYWHCGIGPDVCDVSNDCTASIFWDQADHQTFLLVWFSTYRPNQTVSEKSFIYVFSFIITAFYASWESVWTLSWLEQGLMLRLVLCRHFSDFCGVKEEKVSVMAALCGQTWPKAEFHVPLIHLHGLVRWLFNKSSTRHCFVDNSEKNLLYFHKKRRDFRMFKE